MCRLQSWHSVDYQGRSSMLGVSLNVIMHHQACLLLGLFASLLLKPDKSSASFNPLSGAHAHTLKQRLSCQHPPHLLTNKLTTLKV